MLWLLDWLRALAERLRPRRSCARLLFWLLAFEVGAPSALTFN